MITSPAHRPIIQKIIIVMTVVTGIAVIITGLMTWANTGFSDTFPHLWGVSFLKAVFVLLPFAFLLMALFDKILSRLMPATPLSNVISYLA